MLWNFAIARPVFTTVIFLAIAIFGAYGYYNMPVREIPDVEFPIVSVNVVLPGAEPSVIETEVIDPLEEQINTIEGLKTLQSTAREQVGTITAEFQLWRDIDTATQDVRDRVDRAQRELPNGVEAPIVRQLDPDAQAIMWIALTGTPRWSAVELTRYADETLKERLESIRGVGRIQIGGQKRFAARVRLDAGKLAAHDVTVQQVVDTIRQNNTDIPTGRIVAERREFIVRTSGQYSEAGPLNDLIVSYDDGAPVRIGALGDVVEGVENDRQLGRFTGELTVGLGIVKQSDANTVALAQTVKQRMKELAAEFPPGLEYTIASDDSLYIQDSINSLVTTIFIAAGLVVLVVLIFLRTFRGTIISSLSIPTSLLGGYAAAYALGFSMNTLTMLGFILVIGIVVDDAIVILESCYRHLEQGEERRAAARVGTTEVAYAAIATSAALGAVFIPVAFTQGLIGRFFYQFGMVVAVTVFLSTLTALSLTPMLCSRFLKVPEKHGRLFRALEKAFGAMEGAYAWLLRRALKIRWLVLLIAVALVGLGYWFFTDLSRTFVPTVDRGEFLVTFEMPEGATLDATKDLATRVEEVLGTVPEVQSYFLAIGLAQGAGPGEVNEGTVFANLSTRADRERGQETIVNEVRNKLAAIPMGQAFARQQSGGAGPTQAPVQLVLQDPSLQTLARQQEQIMGWMRGQDEFTGVRTNLHLNKPQVDVRLLRNRMLQQNVSVAQVSNTLRFLLGEPDISELEREGERYEIITEIQQKGQMVPQDLRNIYVRTEQDELVSLANFVKLEETIGPAAIHHYNRIRSATISASLPQGVPLGEALNAARQYIRDDMPEGVQFQLGGEAQDFQESFRYLGIALIFAVIFVYLILAAQFESFIHPFTIMLATPLALVGAFGALWGLGMPFSIYSFIGMIMLIGMATKNAILLVDFTNVLRARGRDLFDAVYEAGRVRFRPVIMTTVSTVLGIMPIALGYGAGGEARAPLGVAVAAGLLATTFLTLIIIPVFYTVLDQISGRAARLARHRKEHHREKKHQKHQRRSEEEPAT